MEQPTSGPIAQLHGAWGQGGNDFALVRWDLCLILLLWSCVKMVCCLLDPFLESLFTYCYSLCTGCFLDNLLLSNERL